MCLFVVVFLFSNNLWGGELGQPPVKYQSSCFGCHSIGADSAPKTGDQAAWAGSMKKGLQTLIQNIKQGKGKMPPNGLCADCSDEDYKELIEFMANQKFAQ